MMVWQSANARDLRKARKEMVSLETEYIDVPNVTVLSCKIDLAHLGNEIEAEATLEIINPGKETLKQFYFVLNPGLKIVGLEGPGGKLLHNIKRHLVIIDHDGLGPGQKEKIAIKYRGAIDENACYLDIDDEDINRQFRINIYPVKKKYAFLQPEYALLTPEARWYPSARLAFNREKGLVTPPQFSEYTLRVSVLPGLTPISQGKRKETEKGAFVFENEYPLTGISLAIGDYIEQSVVVDSVEYFISTLKGHDYYRQYFENIEDSVAHIIREVKNEYESKLELDYPFKRFGIVETPLMFVSYPRLWTKAREVMQPEMSLLPEKGIGIAVADFQFRKDRMEERNKDDGGGETEQEMETDILRTFLTTTLTSQANMFFGADALRYFIKDFEIFPSYYTHAHYLHSNDWPFLGRAFESYLWKRATKDNALPWFEALTNDEKANVALKEKTFNEVLKESKSELVNNVINARGNYIFSLLESKSSGPDYKKDLSHVLEDRRFSVLPYDTFISEMQKRLEDDYFGLPEGAFQDAKMPAYLFDDVRHVSFKKGERTWYGVSFKVANTSDAEGLIDVGFRMGGRGDDNRGFDFFLDAGREENLAGKKLIPIGSGQTVVINTILDDAPAELVVNTLLSENLPATLTFPISKATENGAVLTDTVYAVNIPVSLTKNGEVIVDNEDDGFSFSESAGQTPLRAMIAGENSEEEEKYIPMRWRGPPTWRATVSTSFYGSTVRSAHFIRTGNGREKATWTANLEETAEYEIYAYIGKSASGAMRANEDEAEYQYIVYSAEAPGEVSVPLKTAEDGWNLLGTFYISPGNAKVEMTDASKGRFVVADAIKWVRRD